MGSLSHPRIVQRLTPLLFVCALACSAGSDAPPVTATPSEAEDAASDTAATKAPLRIAWEANHSLLADDGRRLRLVAAPRLLAAKHGWLCNISGSRPRSDGGERRDVRCRRSGSADITFDVACGPPDRWRDQVEKPLPAADASDSSSQPADFIRLGCEVLNPRAD